MDEMDWFRSHVERCLQDAWGLDRVESDAAGNYPFRAGTAACSVMLSDVPGGLVQVYAHAVVGIRRSAKLLAELNEINSTSPTARVYWTEDAVVVEETLWPETVSPRTLEDACAAVGMLGDQIGLLMASTFGGSTLYAAVAEIEEAAG